MEDDGAELRVRSARLRGHPPFPTWNGTVAAPSEDARGLCSVLGADGELVVLRNSCKRGEQEAADSWLSVVKVLPPSEGTLSSFCQCWTSDGAVVATAHDRRVAIYCGEDFRVLAKLQLRYCVTSMDVVKREQTEELLLMVGTAFGSFLYKVAVESKENEGADVEKEDQAPKPVARLHDGVAVGFVKFSHDAKTAAMGTMDGRLFLRSFASHDDNVLTTFGVEVLSRVLSAPRITGMSFSACSTKLVVATRKGNVYVFARASDTGRWAPWPSCSSLSANPKPKAGGVAGTNKAATSAQTLVTWWGPVFVVCSRAITSRIEMYDFASGYLLHSLQLAPTAANQFAEQHLVTGICSLWQPDGSARLLCHDSGANLAVVQWPFLDVIGGKQ
ncbi:unnamed protein product [Phytophthora lilii]|uniref:Unnamed protein product n=1 Tax=Phytophthora lilii TaxID=2077276 RepID=A0A9W6WUL4_9STRA|nr:unnamed protein product [Phytophthora lilii]